VSIVRPYGHQNVGGILRHVVWRVNACCACALVESNYHGRVHDIRVRGQLQDTSQGHYVVKTEEFHAISNSNGEQVERRKGFGKIWQFITRLVEASLH
jgi:hypothetical protein